MSNPDHRKRNVAQGFSTRAIHLGYDPAAEQGALTPPIYQTSTYAFETVEQGAEYFAGTRPGYVYGRTRNPTQALLEQRLASLEGAEAGLAVASGMAAISSTFLTLLRAGDRVIADKILYGNSFTFFSGGWRVSASRRNSSTSPIRQRWPPQAPNPSRRCSSRRRPIPMCG